MLRTKEVDLNFSYFFSIYFLIDWRIEDVKMLRYPKECEKQWRPSQGKLEQQKQKEKVRKEEEGKKQDKRELKKKKEREDKRKQKRKEIVEVKKVVEK